MKKLLKMSLLGLVMSIALISCNGCNGDGKKEPSGVDTTKVDTTKADGTKVKDDTTKADTVTKKEPTKK